MAFERLQYGKSWEDPADFPAYEDSEAQVRADLQYHPNAVRDYINEKLIAALEGPEGAASLGVTGTAQGSKTLQAVLDEYMARFERVDDDISVVAAGGIPTQAQCVAVPFSAGDWTRGEAGYALSVPQLDHKRPGAAFGFRLWEAGADGAPGSTWNTAATQVGTPGEDGAIVLTAPEAYAGTIVFFGL